MSNSQKSETNARQSAVRTTSKHDVNLRKNTVVYFQVGLILALIMAILILEIKSPISAYDPPLMEDVATLSYDDWNEPVRREVKKEVKPEMSKTSDLLPPEVIEDESPLIETELFKPETMTTDTPIDTDSFAPIPEPEIETTDFRKVERVPVFPGCEGLKSNEELRDCMQEKMSSFINRNFDTSLGQEYGLEGVNKVDVQFTIDEYGKVINLKTRAPHPALEKEAERVMNKLPKMEPGKQRDKSVRVIYYQPIRFKVQN